MRMLVLLLQGTEGITSMFARLQYKKCHCLQIGLQWDWALKQHGKRFVELAVSSVHRPLRDIVRTTWQHVDANSCFSLDVTWTHTWPFPCNAICVSLGVLRGLNLYFVNGCT